MDYVNQVGLDFIEYETYETLIRLFIERGAATWDKNKDICPFRIGMRPYVSRYKRSFAYTILPLLFYHAPDEGKKELVALYTKKVLSKDYKIQIKDNEFVPNTVIQEGKENADDKTQRNDVVLHVKNDEPAHVQPKNRLYNNLNRLRCWLGNHSVRLNALFGVFTTVTKNVITKSSHLLYRIFRVAVRR
jgi:hypothetical protein